MSAKPRLLVLNPTALDVVEEHRAWIEAQGVELLAEQSFRALDQEEAAVLLREADAVILPASARTFPHEPHMAAAARLRVCSIAASGYDWLDVAAATRHGIVVCAAAGGVGAEAVADLAWGLMLAVARHIPHHHQRIREGGLERGMGSAVFGKTLGIIGLGHIGKAVAERARGFGMRLLASAPRPDEAFAREHAIEFVSQDELLATSDFVSLHVRLSEQTRAMLGTRELGRMKPTAFLINTARQELIDEEALAAAILERRIAGAALDDPPGAAGKKLLGLPNVIFTPHLGNRAIEGVHGVFRTAIENALAVLRGEQPGGVVNPQVYDQRLRANPSVAEEIQVS